MQRTWVRFLGWEESLGEGKGYPLQYSSLENSTDCMIHGVTKSQTRLSDFHFHTSLWPFLSPLLCLLSFPDLFSPKKCYAISSSSCNSSMKPLRPLEPSRFTYIHSFIEQWVIKDLPCARQHARHWGYSDGHDRHRPCPHRAHIQVRGR